MNLLNLPNELLELIVRSCRISTDEALLYYPHESTYDIRFTDLCSLSQSCKTLYKVTTPILFQIIFVTSDEAIAKLRRTLYAKPELAQYPQMVIIEYGYSDSDHSKIGFLEDLPKVEYLLIQCMDYEIDSDDEDEYGTCDSDRLWSRAAATPLPGAVAPLSSLHSCTLNFSDGNGDFWGTWQEWRAFSHPTLKRLTLDHTTTYQMSTVELIPYLHSTMLQELHFISSDVTLKELELILRCPKSLKALTITNSHGYPSTDIHERNLTEGFIHSMREVSQTLEYLRLHDHRPCINGAAIGLASFSALRVLDIDPELLFGADNLVDVPFAKVIPPNLEILRLSLICEDIDLLCLLELAKNRSTLAPKLQTFIFPRPTEKGPLDMKVCDDLYRDLQDLGMKIEFEECTKGSTYCLNHHGQALLLRWQKSVC